MKISILLLVLACNYKRIACNPGIVESNIDLKRFRENREKSSDAISTKLASTYKNNHHNLIGKNHEKSEKFVPMPSPFQPLHLTRDDVVTSGVPNQHYSHESQQTGGDEFNQLSAATSSPPTLANNGEVIFAIHHSQNSQSSPQFTSAAEFTGQPVLVQYLTPEGEQKVSYVQFLRPIVMVPAQPYQAAQPVTLVTRQPTMTAANAPMTTTATPSFSYMRFPKDSVEEAPYAAALTAASNLHPQQHAAPFQYQSSHHHEQIHQTRRFPFRLNQNNFELNMNEILPSASSQSFSSVLPPSQPIASPFLQPFHHMRLQQQHVPQFRRFAQRA